MFVFRIPKILLACVGQKLAQKNMRLVSKCHHLIFISRMLNTWADIVRARVFRCSNSSIRTEPTDVLVRSSDIVFEKGDFIFDVIGVDILLRINRKESQQKDED